MCAGIVAVADQGRAAAGLGSLDGASQTLPALYQIDKTTPIDFHDITDGESIAGPLYAPGAGYDLATGLGSPASDLLIPRLAGFPGVTGVSSTQATGAYGAGTPISIQVTFNQPVTVTGTPQLSLNAGDDAVANYASGSGTPTLTFTYNVAAGQSSSDLDYASTTALALNGGSIQDAVGDAALLVLPTTGSDGLATKSIVIDTTAPTVTNVVVGNTAWTGDFLSYLVGQNSQNVGGYSIPVGSGAQLTTLPWANIDQIKVTFSKNVTVNQSDLLLTGVNVPSYDVGGGTWSYDPGSFTATWTLPQPIGDDKLMLALNAGGSGPIEDAAGNRLDGQWINPTSTSDTGTSAYPSGDGVAGGDFDFRFNVLPGDATQDGLVGFADLNKVLTSYHRTGMSWSRGDVTGDGIVNSDDLNAVLANYDASLPSGSPTAGMFPAFDFGQAAVVATTASTEITVASQTDATAGAVTEGTSGPEQANAAASGSTDSQMVPASSDPAPAADASASGQPVAAADSVNEMAASSPADSAPNIPTSDNGGSEEPGAATVASESGDSQAILTSSDNDPIAAAGPSTSEQAAAPSDTASETIVPNQAAVVPDTATADSSGAAAPAPLVTASANGDDQAIAAPASPVPIAVTEPSAADQTVGAAGVVSTATVPAAPTRSVDSLTLTALPAASAAAAATVLPTEPSPVHNSTPDVLPVVPVSATLPAADVADRPVPSVLTPAADVTSFVAQSTPPAARGFRTTAASAIPARLAEPLANVAANMTPWTQAMPSANGSPASGPATISTNPERAAQDPAEAAFADQLRAYDAVLAGAAGTSSADEPAWLFQVTEGGHGRQLTGSLESLTDAVEDALAAHDDLF
jgi:hypothetical protein